MFILSAYIVHTVSSLMFFLCIRTSVMLFILSVHNYYSHYIYYQDRWVVGWFVEGCLGLTGNPMMLSNVYFDIIFITAVKLLPWPHSPSPFPACTIMSEMNCTENSYITIIILVHNTNANQSARNGRKNNL